MKHNTVGHSKTKRGNKYNTRSTKTATGYSKVLADCEALKRPFLGYKEDQEARLLKLAVHGTLDSLAKSLNFDRETVITRNPLTGREARKKVISERGLKKLNRLKKNKLNRRL